MTRFNHLYTLCFILWMAFSVQDTKACDACGCALGGFNFGLVPQEESHFIGLKYSQARFYAEMVHGAAGKEFSHDRYQRLDLMGRVAISERLQLNLIAPFMRNHMNGSHEKERLNGMGDPMAILNYKLINQKGNPMEKWLHNLWVGGGLKAPLASFTFSQTEQLINPSFQLGSGSWDMFSMVNYTAMRNRLGLNLESAFKYNTSNSQDYRFGNQWNIQGNLFYVPKTEKVQWVPMAGFYHEYGGVHTFEGFDQVNSGGRATMAQVGLQVQFGNLMLHGNYQQPISQSFNSDHHVDIEAHGRFSLTVITFFGRSSKSSVFNFTEN
jgi:hypothetical protein